MLFRSPARHRARALAPSAPPRRRRINFEVRPRKGCAVIFFPGFMNGELDADVLHAGLPPVGVKYVSQVWLRQSFREDGQPSQQVRVAPLHDHATRARRPSATIPSQLAHTHAPSLPGAQSRPCCRRWRVRSRSCMAR